MAKNLIYYRIPLHSPAWHRFRTTGLTDEDCKTYNLPAYEGGIGGSESAIIMGMSEWRPVAGELYAWKAGVDKPNNIDNRAMRMGRILEPIIKDLWRCWDGTKDGWVDNYNRWEESLPGTREKELIRNASKINAYIVNPKYPFLFVSLDYYAEKGTPNLFDGELAKYGFPVEIKTINGYYAKKWESGVPIYHKIQVQQQMLIMDVDYCELAILKDGRDFDVIPFKRDDTLCERIISIGERFWKKVLIARQAKVEMDRMLVKNDTDGAGEMKSIIDSNEPEPDDSEAYKEYLTERKREDIKQIDGTIQEYRMCQDDQFLKELIKMLEAKRQGIENYLLNRLVKTGAEEMSFGQGGKFTYLKNKKGTYVKQFDVLIQPPQYRLDEEFNKLNFRY